MDELDSFMSWPFSFCVVSLIVGYSDVQRRRLWLASLLCRLSREQKGGFASRLAGLIMNIQSYTIVHYGKEYIRYALRSVYDFMDLLHIIYTPHPSHGSRTEHAIPETKEEIIREVFAHDPDHKIKWHEVHNVWDEGPHRDMALETCRSFGAETVLVLDCDEVWPEDTLTAALAFIADQEEKPPNWLVNFTTLWRSFDWCCKDNMWPVRFINFNTNEDGPRYLPKELGEIYHFGYAVPSPLMWYKWEIHGHKGELRSNWWRERWSRWPPVDDCHPTCERTWFPQRFDKYKLPEIMREHPYFNLERIE